MLISEVTYRRISGDVLTQSPECSALIEDATNMVEEYLGRWLEAGTYTEVTKVGPNGVVYPRAIPLSSVPASASYEMRDTATLRGVDPDDTPFVGWDFLDSDPASGAIVGPAVVGYAARQPVTTVTYDGGYTEATLPATLKRYICLLAAALRAPGQGGAQGVSPLRTTASVGDVSVSGYVDGVMLDSLDEYVPGMTRALRPYVHPNRRL